MIHRIVQTWIHISYVEQIDVKFVSHKSVFSWHEQPSQYIAWPFIKKRNIIINYIFSLFSEMIPEVINTVKSDFGWDDEYDYDGLW